MHRLYAGPITRVEALEIPKLIEEVRVDLRDPKIGMLNPQIKLYAYETMAELERALPAHLDDLATTRCERAGRHRCPLGLGISDGMLQRHAVRCRWSTL
jgi:hypothetical protein